MPDWSREIRERLSSVPLAPAREAEIVDELSQHLEDRYQELLAAGLPPEDAARQARDAFRDRDTLGRYLRPLRQARHEEPVPPRRASVLHGLAADLRHAYRALRAAPAFTAAALVVMTLGIGATTTIFSVVDAVVLRALPFDDPDRIVAVGERNAPRQGPKAPRAMPGAAPEDPDALQRIEPQNYLDWVAGQRVFDPIAAMAGAEFTLRLEGAAPDAVPGYRVSASFFEVLRARPAAGRFFGVEHETDGNSRVAVLSADIWRQRFAGDPAVIGRPISLNGDPYEVIGVMPADASHVFAGAIPPAVWVPYVMPPEERVRGRGRAIYLQSIARLKPGVTLEQAQAQMRQVAATIAEANPATQAGHGIGVRLLRDSVVGSSTRAWMLMLLAAAGIVLLIACGNVANLWLARAAVRDRDVAVRAVLGASRWRILRLCLTESLLVSAAGAALAIAFAWQGTRILKAALPAGLVRVDAIGLDLRVLGAAVLLAAATGVLAGIVPAIQASGPKTPLALHENARAAGPARARRRWRSALVVVEVALAVVLLVGASLFTTSFINVMRLDLGFSTTGVVAAQILSPPSAPQGASDLAAPLLDIVDRLRGAPGVVSAAAVSPGMPLRINMRIDGLAVPGRPREADPSVSIKIVSPDYFRTLSIPLRAGRSFTPQDRGDSAPVIILSDAAARVFFPGESPVGRTVTFMDLQRTLTVVGVVASARQSSVEVNAHPEVYLPMAQRPVRQAFLVVRAAGDPAAVLPDMRTIVAGALPDVPLRSVATMDSLVAAQTATRRLNMLVLGLFSLLGLAIAAVGIFGVISYLVAQRTREIGVRMALGATPAGIVAMVLRHAALLVTSGLAIGGVAAWYLSTAACRFLFGLDAHDGRTFAMAAATLVPAALIAAVLPASRAARVDPAVALRAE